MTITPAARKKLILIAFAVAAAVVDQLIGTDFLSSVVPSLFGM